MLSFYAGENNLNIKIFCYVFQIQSCTQFSLVRSAYIVIVDKIINQTHKFEKKRVNFDIKYGGQLYYRYLLSNLFIFSLCVKKDS